MLVITITDDFPAVGAKFDAAAAAAPAIIDAQLMPMAESIKEVVVPILADHTPVRSGALQASTEGEVVGGGGEAIVNLYQPAKSLPNQDGSGGGIEYWEIVVSGRGEVVPVNKKALAGPNFGPVKRSGPAAANPYPDEAVQAMESPVEAVLITAVYAMGEAIIAVI